MCMEQHLAGSGAPWLRSPGRKQVPLPQHRGLGVCHHLGCPSIDLSQVAGLFEWLAGLDARLVSTAAAWSAATAKLTCVGFCWLQCSGIRARSCLWVLGCPRVSGRAELPGAMGRCCWLPAAGSALLELCLQLQLGAEQAASCLRGGLGSFEKERPMGQVQSRSCFVCWWLWGDLLGCRSGSDCLCLLAVRLKMGGCPDRGPLASKFPRQERGTVL